MPQSIFCQKLQKDAPQMSQPPFIGDEGLRIYQHISQEAWDLWLEKQTKIINENRLSPINPEHKKQLQQAMRQFLFGEDV